MYSLSSALYMAASPALRVRLEITTPPKFARYKRRNTGTLPSWYKVVSVLANNKHVISAGRQDYITELQKHGSEIHERDEVEKLPLKLQENVDENGEKDDVVGCIKRMLNSMGDGRISISAYDTAWMAVIKREESGGLLFPSSLEWIAENQLPDGSWGDAHQFLIYDRLLNTLASVIALATSDVHLHKQNKGISFVKENISKLEGANIEHMTSGFEIVFPALIEEAKKLSIELPFDAPVLKNLLRMRDMRISRIPKEMMYKTPTTLLFSLEGLGDLDWERLLKLQTPLGSFLTSPASTAFVYMHTRDQKCFQFLQQITSIFKGGAPPTYPVDLFARLWVVDRLQRLGISNYFRSEIKDCLDFVHRYWTENGIFSGRESNLNDIDDTAMGFRLLRLHGYTVSPDVFRNFKNGNEFSCYQGQMIEAPSPMFNLYRASQVSFPGEEILEEARSFSFKFLRDKLEKNQLKDKWVISKALDGEVGYGLEMPWYANLPRIETRFYLDHYGGADDVWISKTLYRMPDVSSNVYLKLAKLDFNECQAQHQMEWNDILKWHRKNKFEELFGIRRELVLQAYFVAAASRYEVEKSIERMAWAKGVVISQCIRRHLVTKSSFNERGAFAHNLRENGNVNNPTCNMNKISEVLLSILQEFLHQLTVDSFKHLGRDISSHLNFVWEMWLLGFNNINGEARRTSNGEAGLVVDMLNILAGHFIESEETLSHQEYSRLSIFTDGICCTFENYHIEKIKKYNFLQVPNMESCSNNAAMCPEIEAKFQKLVKLVLGNPSEINQKVKETFLEVAKTYYYKAYCSLEAIDSHIEKVLFQPVE